MIRENGSESDKERNINTTLVNRVRFGEDGMQKDLLSLLNANANANAHNREGRTALFYCKGETTTQLLLDRGASTSITDGYGINALAYNTDVGAIRTMLQHLTPTLIGS